MTTDDQQDDAATETVRDTLARLGFAKKRAILEVSVSLDPVPGWGNIPEDYRVLTQRLLDDAIPHYEPVVTLADSEQAVLVAKVAELEAEVERRTASQLGLLDSLNAVKDRADAAEATLAKVAALADEWDSPPEPTPWAGPYYADRLRAALASASRPATSDGAAPSQHQAAPNLGASTSDGDDANGLGDWFRRTPESLALLAEECAALAASEDTYAARPASPVVAPSATDEDGGR